MDDRKDGLTAAQREIWYRAVRWEGCIHFDCIKGCTIRDATNWRCQRLENALNAWAATAAGRRALASSQATEEK